MYNSSALKCRLDLLYIFSCLLTLSQMFPTVFKPRETRHFKHTVFELVTCHCNRWYNREEGRMWLNITSLELFKTFPDVSTLLPLIFFSFEETLSDFFPRSWTFYRPNNKSITLEMNCQLNELSYSSTVCSLRARLGKSFMYKCTSF